MLRRLLVKSQSHVNPVENNSVSYLGIVYLSKYVLHKFCKNTKTKKRILCCGHNSDLC